MMRATVLALVLSTATAAAQAPPIPSARPVPGFAVALLTTGIDYSKPDIAEKLARDGEGEAIAWSAVSETPRPFVRGGSDDPLMRMAPFLIAPVQIDPARPATWTRALSFLVKTPLRVVVLTTAPPPPRPDFASAPTLLFLRPADETDTSPRPDNLIAIAALSREVGVAAARRVTADIILAPPAATREAPGGPEQPPRTAVEAALLAAALFTCMDLRAARSPAEAKRILIAKAEAGLGDAAPILSACR